jgi:hypothetical protein
MSLLFCSNDESDDMTDSPKRKQFIKQQHEALIEAYPEMTRKERREFIKENVIKAKLSNKSDVSK